MVRRVVVLAVALVAGVQLFGVTFISIPPQSAPPGTRAAAEVLLHSYFEEEWKLFAPSPVNADRDLMVQAAWRDGDSVETGSGSTSPRSTTGWWRTRWVLPARPT